MRATTASVGFCPSLTQNSSLSMGKTRPFRPNAAGHTVAIRWPYGGHTVREASDRLTPACRPAQPQPHPCLSCPAAVRPGYGSAGPVRLGTNSRARRLPSASWSGVSLPAKSFRVTSPLFGSGRLAATAAHLQASIRSCDTPSPVAHCLARAAAAAPIPCSAASLNHA